MENKPLPKKKRKLFYLWLAFVLLVCIGMVALYIYQTPQRVLYSWVQYGPVDSATARAIVAQDTCPPITIDKVNYPMTIRSGKDEILPVTVC